MSKAHRSATYYNAPIALLVLNVKMHNSNIRNTLYGIVTR